MTASLAHLDWSKISLTLLWPEKSGVLLVSSEEPYLSRAWALGANHKNRFGFRKIRNITEN